MVFYTCAWEDGERINGRWGSKWCLLVIWIKGESSRVKSSVWRDPKSERYRFQDFFWYQIFLIPVPIPSEKINNSREQEFPGPGRHTLQKRQLAKKRRYRKGRDEIKYDIIRWIWTLKKFQLKNNRQRVFTVCEGRLWNSRHWRQANRRPFKE